MAEFGPTFPIFPAVDLPFSYFHLYTMPRKRSSRSPTPTRRSSSKRLRRKSRSPSRSHSPSSSRSPRGRKQTPSRSPTRRSPSKSPSKDVMPKAQVVEKNGEISCSIEETNRIRQSLGLKPLNVDREKKKKAEDERHKKELDERKEEVAKQEVLEKVAALKRKREFHKKVDGPTIADEAAEEEGGDDSAAAWVIRSRKKEEERKLRELENAKKRASALDEIDDDIQQRQSKSYGRKNLAGLALAHNVGDFEEGETTILTLKDSNVLDDEDDVLENVSMKEDEKTAENIRKKRQTKLYDATEEGKNILSQYDEEEKPELLRLGGKGDVEADKISQAEAVRSKLKAETGKVEYQLKYNMALESDYLTKEDVAFKKGKKKKRKVRKKESLKLEPIVENGGDHGSRASAAAKASETRRQEEADKLSSYQKAIDKELVKSKALREDDVQEEDGFDQDLQASLSRARNIAQKQSLDSVSQIAESVVSRRSNNGGAEDDSREDTLVFTATTEFIRNLETAEEKEAEITIKARKVMPNSADAFEGTDSESKSKPEAAIKEEAEDGDAIMEDHEPEEADGGGDREGEEEGAPALAEPSVGRGLASALQFARHRGMLQSEKPTSRDDYLGRANDKLLDPNFVTKTDIEKKGLRICEYYDEFGRLLTPKEAFRKQSHRFHGITPGKGKTEKYMKKYADAKLKANMDPSSMPLMKALTNNQGNTHQPFMVISGKDASLGGNNVPPPQLKKGKK